MNANDKYPIAKHLKTPIAIVNEHGGVEWSNDAFEATFGDDANDWLTQAARAVAGESGWLQGFFLDADAHRSLDVDIEGRTYRVDKIMQVDDYATPDRRALVRRRDAAARGGAGQVRLHRADRPRPSRAALRNPGHARIRPLAGRRRSWIRCTLDLLTEAQRESERMMSLINEIMDFSKIQSGSFAVEQEPVRIAGLLKRAVRSLQSVASRDEVFLLSAHGRDVPQIIGSVEKLTQAVINLISNSLKFTPKKGLISVGAQIIRNGDVPEAIVITVTDSGMGIKATELQQIWDKYKQSGNKSLRGGGGTGLGLYIVKQVVEAHGGEVTVASIEGVGTSMVLKLPVTRAA